MEPIQESRERQRLYAPSRSSLRHGLPEARSGVREAGGDPWLSDHAWRAEGENPDYSVGTHGSLRGRVILVAVIGLLNLGLVSHSHLLENIALILDLFGVVVLFDLLLRVWQGFRRSRLRWTTFPTFLGGRLEGVLIARPTLQPIGPVRAVLRCVQDQRVVHPGHPGRPAQATKDAEEVTFEPTVIYQQISEVHIAEDRLKELPLSFTIPPDLPGTDLGRDDAIYWQIALRIPVVGPDVETVFLAPVYAPRS